MVAKGDGARICAGGGGGGGPWGVGGGPDGGGWVWGGGGGGGGVGGGGGGGGAGCFGMWVEALSADWEGALGGWFYGGEAERAFGVD